LGNEVLLNATCLFIFLYFIKIRNILTGCYKYSKWQSNNDRTSRNRLAVPSHRQAVHNKNPKWGDNGCAAWRHMYACQAISRQNPKLCRNSATIQRVHAIM